ncbi:MAG: hypothetical protein RLY20_3173 [Verrucomicrobiota bacterium]|jgi:hypothetical protein
MNSKQIGILLALVIVVGLGGVWLNQRNNASWAGGTKSSGGLLSKLPVGEQLARVTIKQGASEVNLVKSNDTWRVAERAGYPANYAELSSAILKLRELKPVQTEQIGASQFGRLELGSNTMTVVEFRDASGKTLDSLRLGKQQMRKGGGNPQFGGEDMGGYPAGRWLMTGDAKDTALLVSDPLANLAPKPESWLSKDFIKVEKIKSIAVTYPVATNSWSVSRTNESGSEWTLANATTNEVLDSSKVSGFNYALSSPSFEDVVAKPDGAAFGLDKPTVISIGTFDDLTYTFHVGTKAGDSLPLTVSVTGTFAKERIAGKDEKPEDKTRLDSEFTERLKKLNEKLASEKTFENWTFLVSSWTLESLLKTRHELLQDKKADSTTANPPADQPNLTEPSLK